jgi:hypothetical protein
MELEVESQVGAAKHERSDDRTVNRPEIAGDPFN